MEYIKTCEVCAKEYKSERSTARYCSSTCRSNANRNATLSSPNATLSNETVTLSPKTNMELLEERIAGKYKPQDITIELLNRVCPDALYEFTFVPNWLKHGYDKQELQQLASIH